MSLSRDDVERGTRGLWEASGPSASSATAVATLCLGPNAESPPPPGNLIWHHSHPKMALESKNWKECEASPAVVSGTATVPLLPTTKHTFPRVPGNAHHFLNTHSSADMPESHPAHLLSAGSSSLCPTFYGNLHKFTPLFEQFTKIYVICRAVWIWPLPPPH